jgi:hypothetical protein
MLFEARGESGQTAVEFGIICLILLMMTAGLIDAGRAFFQYNAVADAARFGARWASVQGGTCNLPGGNPTADWCTQQGLVSSTVNFYAQTGSKPLQGNGVACPSFSSTPADYYKVSDPDNDSDNDYSSDTDSDPITEQTTVVGAIGQRFDTNSSSTSMVHGSFAGFDLSNLRVCIATSDSSAASPTGADYVTVVVHYHFTPVSFILAQAGFNLESSSTYEIEGSP